VKEHPEGKTNMLTLNLLPKLSL